MSMHTITRPAVALVAASLLLALAGCSGPSGAVTRTPTAPPSASPSAAVTTAPDPESTDIVAGGRTTSGPQGVDDAFLASWKSFFPQESNDLAIAQALNICDEFKVGSTYTQEVQTLESNSGVTPGDAAFMIGTAEIAYCPEFSGNM